MRNDAMHPLRFMPWIVFFASSNFMTWGSCIFDCRIHSHVLFSSIIFRIPFNMKAFSSTVCDLMFVCVCVFALVIILFNFLRSIPCQRKGKSNPAYSIVVHYIQRAWRIRSIETNILTFKYHNLQFCSISFNGISSFLMSDPMSLEKFITQPQKTFLLTRSEIECAHFSCSTHFRRCAWLCVCRATTSTMN